MYITITSARSRYFGLIVGFDKMIKNTHQKYTYKFKYYRNNILFSAEWANGAKVSMKFVPQ